MKEPTPDTLWIAAGRTHMVDATIGSLGRSDIVTATWADDPTVTTAHMIR